MNRKKYFNQIFVFMVLFKVEITKKCLKNLSCIVFNDFIWFQLLSVLFFVYKLLSKNIVTMSNNQFLIENYKIYQYYIWGMGNIIIIQVFVIFSFISITNQKISNTNQKVSNTKIIYALIIQLSLILLVYLQFLKNIVSLTQKNYFLTLLFNNRWFYWFIYNY